jgi:integrase
MARKKLSALSIPKLSPGDWHDTLVPGLILRVGANRSTWTYRYTAGGKKLRLTLGHHPVMGLADAREACRKASERIDGGAMPKAAAPHPRSPDALTLGALLDRYEAMRLREGQRIKALPKVMRMLRRHLKPWLRLPAAEFSKADLRAARDSLIEAGTPVQANRLLAAVSAAMGWAAQEDMVEVNLAPAIRRTPEQKRSRVLTKQEIKAVWRACDDLGPHDVANNFARLVKFLLLTGQRRTEVATLRHGDIIDSTWRQVVNKAMRPHSLPLPPLALALVGKGEARDYVFSGRLGQMGGFSKWKAALDKASGVSGWVLHDLRRSCASHMQECGVPDHVVRAVLNHAIAGVSAVYLRGELEAQKRAALATWAVTLEKIVRPMTLVAS